MKKIKNREINQSIFQYSCPHEFINYVWDCKKQNNPSYSLRAWARDLGFNSNTTLTMLLAKKRSFTKKQALRISRNLKFDFAESDFFDALIDYSLEESKEGKNYYAEKLKRLKKVADACGESLQTYKHFAAPEITTIFEMIGLRGKKRTAENIHREFVDPIDIAKVEAAINTLLELQLVELDLDGGLKKVKNSFNYSYEKKSTWRVFIFILGY